MMSVSVLLFYLFAAGTIAGALGVVLNRNPMYSAISLLGSFVSVAVLFFLRNAEFLGVVQLFVYGGGIMVLFLFVIMLVNLYQLRDVQLFAGHAKGAVLVVVLMAALFLFLFLGIDFGPAFADPDAFVVADGEVRGNSEAVAWVLYRDYLLPFEIASVFLLVAMMGAVILGRKN
jgi:NADH-quinone oxidoreductase subunit J